MRGRRGGSEHAVSVERLCRVGLRHVWVLLSFVVVLTAVVPAQAYVGNYMALYWSARRKLVQGHFGAAERYTKAGMSEEKRWWSRLDGHTRMVERHGLSAIGRRRDLVDMELAFLKLRNDFHAGLMAQAEDQLRELREPGYGVIGATFEDRQLVYRLDKALMVAEVAAARAEQEQRDYARGRQLWGEALTLRERSLDDLKARRQAVGGGAGSEARIAYLDSEIARYEEMLTRLRAEYEWATDPIRVAGRMRFNELKSELYTGMYRSVYAKLGQHYRDKAIYACSLATEKDPSRKDEMDRLAAELANGGDLGVGPEAPTWYYSVEFELPLFEFPPGGDERFDEGLARLANRTPDEDTADTDADAGPAGGELVPLGN